MNKCIYLLISLIFMSQSVLAKEVAVKVSPAVKLTTSNMKIMQGDKTEFFVTEDVKISPAVYLKKGDKVSGVVTSREENGFLGQVATIYIENLYAVNSDGKRIKLKGVVYKRGTCHDVINGFLEPFVVIIRGGEVQMEPNKDIFTVYTEVK